MPVPAESERRGETFFTKDAPAAAGNGEVPVLRFPADAVGVFGQDLDLFPFALQNLSVSREVLPRGILILPLGGVDQHGAAFRLGFVDAIRRAGELGRKSFRRRGIDVLAQKDSLVEF